MSSSVLLCLCTLFGADALESHSLIGHTGAVVHVAFTPDGERLVSASSDCTARVWSVKERKELAKLQHDFRVVRAFPVAGNGIFTVETTEDSMFQDVRGKKRLAGLKTRCYLWPDFTKVATAQNAPPAIPIGGSVLGCTVSPNGEYVILRCLKENGSSGDCEVILLDVATQQRLWTHDYSLGTDLSRTILYSAGEIAIPNRTRLEAFLTNDKVLVGSGSGKDRGRHISVVDCKSGEETRSIKTAGLVKEIAIGRGGRALAAAVATDRGELIQHWTLDSDRSLVITPPMSGTIGDLGFCGDGHVGFFLLRGSRIVSLPQPASFFHGTGFVSLKTGGVLPVSVEEKWSGIKYGRTFDTSRLSRVGIHESQHLLVCESHLTDQIAVVSLEGDVPRVQATLRYDDDDKRNCSRLLFSPDGSSLVATVAPPDVKSHPQERFIQVWDLSASLSPRVESQANRDR